MDDARGGGCYDLRTVSVIIVIISLISLGLIYLLWNAIPEEKQTEFNISDSTLSNSSFVWAKPVNYTSAFFFKANQTESKLFEVRSLNGSAYSNSTITINMSHIAEMQEKNGSMIIEIRKNPESIYKESPQQHLIVGDVVYTTDEFYRWKGDTTSFSAWVIGIEDNGTVYLKIRGGSWTGQDGNNFTLNEYWVEKAGHDNESAYTGWHWP